jgi:hypothetical protein
MYIKKAKKYIDRFLKWGFWARKKAINLNDFGGSG